MSPLPEHRRPWWKAAFPIKIVIVAVPLPLLYLIYCFPLVLVGLGISFTLVLTAIAVRKWRKLRRTTAAFAVVMVLVVILANLPGQDLLYLDDASFFWSNHYEHGWPMTYLSRELPTSPASTPLACWRLTSQVESFSILPLCLDLFVCASFAALATLAFEHWLRHRRPGLRLSLLEAFAAMTAISVVCIWVGYEKREFDAEQSAIREIQALMVAEGTTIFDSGPTYHRRGPAFLREIVGDNGLHFLDRVACSGNVDLNPIFASRFRYLSYFRPYEDIGPEEISALTTLSRLKAIDGRISSTVKESLTHPGEGGLVDLPPMPSLQFFASNQRLSEGELDWLAKCWSLHYVDLHSKGNADLARLKGLTHLRSASFQCSEPFAEETLELISTWSDLRELRLDGKVSAKGLAHLKRLKNLRDLRLTGYKCELGDFEIAELNEFSHLEQLWVSKRVVSDSALRHLQKTLPKTLVTQHVERND